jgi:hypothetical protein
MPRGIPNKKQEPATGTEEQANGAAKPAGRKGINKLQRVRDALTELGNDAQPKDIQGFLKRKFNLDMTTKFISTYKGTVLREAAKKSGVIRQPAVAPAPAPPKAPSKSGGTNGGISVEDIRAVKGLVEKIGAEALKELAEVLAQ